VGGGGVGGVGAHRVVERGVPTPQGHAQGPPVYLSTKLEPIDDQEHP
jgi:hypothetical protein